MSLDKNSSGTDNIIIDHSKEHATKAFHEEFKPGVRPEFGEKKNTALPDGFPDLIITHSTPKDTKTGENVPVTKPGNDGKGGDPYLVLLDSMIADYEDDGKHRELTHHDGDSAEHAKQVGAEKETWKQLREAYLQGDPEAEQIVRNNFGEGLTMQDLDKDALKSRKAAEAPIIENKSSKAEVSDKPIVSDKPAAPAEPIDATGRPEKEGHRERIEKFLKPLSETELAASRALVEKDLSNYKIADSSGKTVSVLDSLNATNMSKTERDQVLNAMAEVRERYSSLGSPEQMGSYNHSLGEMGEVIAMTKRQGFTGAQTQQTVLAALFSDSVKAGWSPAMGGNFFSHHLDGAQAAATVMERNGFSKQDVHNVVQAILEHQISPPGFMAGEYSKLIKQGITSDREKELADLNAKFKRNETFTVAEFDKNKELQKAAERYAEALKEVPRLDAELKTRDLYPFEAKQYAKHQDILARGKFITPDEAKQIAGIKEAIADPLHAEREPGKVGGEIIKFSPEQRDLMAKYSGSGTENWHIPAEGSIGQVVVAADGRNNYGPAVDAHGNGTNGTSKIMALRGPLSTSTPDATMESAINAIKASDAGALNLLPEAQKEHYTKRSEEGAKVYKDAQAATNAWVEEQLRTRPVESLPANLREYRNTPPGTPLAEVPYLQKPLELLPSTATPDQRKAWLQQPEVKLAGEIHDHFVNQLRSVNHLDGKHSELSTTRGVPSTELELAKEQAQKLRDANLAKTAPPMSGAELARQKSDENIVHQMQETLKNQDYRLKSKDGSVDRAQIDRVFQIMQSRTQESEKAAIKNLHDRYRANDPEAVKRVHSALGLPETLKPAEAAHIAAPGDATRSAKISDAVQKIKAIAAAEPRALDGITEHEHLSRTFQKHGIEESKAKQMSEDLLSQDEHRMAKAVESMKLEPKFKSPGAFKGLMEELHGNAGALAAVALLVGGLWAGSGYSNEAPGKPATWKGNK